MYVYIFRYLKFKFKFRNSEAEELLELLFKVGVNPSSDTLKSLLLMFYSSKNYQQVLINFDRYLEKNFTPDEETWSLIISSNCRLGKIQEGIAILDRLIALGIKPSVSMHNSILDALVRKNSDHEKVRDFWMRMHLDDIELSKESFTIMLKFCSNTREAERAFFYMDEMRGYSLLPDALTFVALFRACAEAPHWVILLTTNY